MLTYIIIGLALVAVVALLVILKSKKSSDTPSPSTVATQKVPKKPKVSLKSYPKFDHSRLIEMGLPEEEAHAYIQELIPQIEEQIPLIKAALQRSDFEEMERITHSIKGSATTIGTGGVSDLLVDFNTYLKTKKDIATLEAYIEQLVQYSEALKKQYA